MSDAGSESTAPQLPANRYVFETPNYQVAMGKPLGPARPFIAETGVSFHLLWSDLKQQRTIHVNEDVRANRLLALMPGVLKRISDTYWTDAYSFLARKAPGGPGSKRTIMESIEATTESPGILFREPIHRFGEVSNCVVKYAKGTKTARVYAQRNLLKGEECLVLIPALMAKPAIVKQTWDAAAATAARAAAAADDIVSESTVDPNQSVQADEETVAWAESSDADSDSASDAPVAEASDIESEPSASEWDSVAESDIKTDAEENRSPFPSPGF